MKITKTVVTFTFVTDDDVTIDAEVEYLGFPSQEFLDKSMENINNLQDSLNNTID